MKTRTDKGVWACGINENSMGTEWEQTENKLKYKVSTQ
jgi:hypothetical protein